MDKKIISTLILVALVFGAVFIWYSRAENESVPKPNEWGLTDPPAANNLTWAQIGGIQLANETFPEAPSFYGEMQKELLKLGYSMVMGNWSNISCQWGVWENIMKNRTYYIAYSGEHFLGIRGPYINVMDAAEKHWLCQDPANASIMVTPSPESTARAISLQIGDIMMRQNISIAPHNWTGPLPDWYLGKFSFKIKTGKGVEVLVLTYTSREQAEYARYLLKKAERDLKILRDYGGQYYSLIVLKGNKNDVAMVVKLIQSQ